MRSLKSRILWITLFAVFISSLLAFMAANVHYHMQLKPYNDAKLTAMLANLQQFAEKNAELTEPYLASVAAMGYELLLVDGQGVERHFGNPFRVNDLSPEQMQRVVAGEPYHGVAQFPNKPFITGFFDNRLSNTVGGPIVLESKPYALFMRPDVSLQFGELRIFFAIILVLTVLFCVLIFIYVCARSLIKPILDLTEATKQIAKGRYAVQLPYKRKDEIGQLAAHFTTMSREVERAERVRQEFVANVSHEIQSPLSSIQGFAAALRRDGLPLQEREEYLTIIEKECGRLSGLGKQLLVLSALDHTAPNLAKRMFNLRSQLRQVLQSYTWEMTDKELAVKLELTDLQVHGNEELLHQVWANLIGNAVKYTPHGAAITIAAAADAKNCIVRISDTGEGIPEKELPYLFDRFYRGDKARERASGSSGLGLSIAQKIVHLHNGTIVVTSLPGVGTTFTVTLPLSV